MSCRAIFLPLFIMAGTAMASSNGQSMLRSAGRQAATVESLWWLFFWILLAVYVLVLLFLAAAIWKRRTAPHLDVAGVYIPRHTEKGVTISIGIAVIITAALLFIFMLTDFAAGRKLNALASAPDPLTIQVKAQQWWWEFTYVDDQLTSNTFTTANDIHLPTGRPVRVELQSPDVVHSFWIPNLIAKHDVVPGYPYAIFLQADKEGDFYGQCAEFCGHQHAHMRFTVKTESPEAFEKWLVAQRTPSPPPQNPSQQRGQDVFMNGTCAMCHSISGTPARARLGPDLSHIASRPTLAAGTLANNRGNLAGWIMDAQHTKPGARMPQNTLSPEDLQALLDYLESLK